MIFNTCRLVSRGFWHISRIQRMHKFDYIIAHRVINMLHLNVEVLRYISFKNLLLFHCILHHSKPKTNLLVHTPSLLNALFISWSINISNSTINYIHFLKISILHIISQYFTQDNKRNNETDTTLNYTTTNSYNNEIFFKRKYIQEK